MKKGFTLIELLAVILILGIIALIAIPQVTNVIEDSKKGAMEVSAENYIKALQDKLTLEELKDGNVLDGTKSISEINEEYPNLVNGDAPSSGTITITNGKVTNANFTNNNYTTTCINGKCTATKLESGNYVYFQSVGVFTSLDQTITTRPTQYKVYLKIDKNDITKIQACIYDDGKEKCLNNNYDTTKQEILNYFAYNSLEWTQDSSNANLWLKTPGDDSIECEISSSYTICHNSIAYLSIYDGDGLYVYDDFDEFDCSVHDDGSADCGQEW